MRLVFIGADHEVTGSCHYLRVGSKNILVDFGMEQGRDVYENVELPVSKDNIDYVFLTHAHIDHSGMLPQLYAAGFRGQVISTRATMDLCSIMLRDAAHIQMQEAEEKTKRNQKNGSSEVAVPAYTIEDAANIMRLFVPYPYDTVCELCEGVKFRFTDIGHLLGSASIEIWLEEKGQERKIVFSGDIGNLNQPLLRDPLLTEEADYVLTESTYGDRLHEKSNGDPIRQLADAISETLGRGGNLVIPAFAVGRTQVMLYYIKRILEEKMIPELPDFPVYVDSPLAVSATGVFENNEQDCFDEEARKMLDKGINPLTFRGLHLSITTEESIAINEDTEPKVIISASGMCDAGRIRHHIRHNITRPESTILFVGYQAEGSLGRKLLEGVPEIKIMGDTLSVEAQITQIEGMSGHADRDGLLRWIRGFKEKPKHVFVVHGDDEVAAGYAKLLHDEYGYTATAPFSGSEFDLISGEYTKVAKGRPIEKKASVVAASDSYTKLKISLKRLEQVIDKASGMPNRDLDEFTKAVNNLCRKFGN